MLTFADLSLTMDVDNPAHRMRHVQYKEVDIVVPYAGVPLAHRPKFFSPLSNGQHVSIAYSTLISPHLMFFFSLTLRLHSIVEMASRLSSPSISKPLLKLRFARCLPYMDRVDLFASLTRNVPLLSAIPHHLIAMSSKDIAKPSIQVLNLKCP